ncbi:ATP-binding protein [Ghiorsea bivora]|uniref:ATP-binding protein n=1 Tax=Ghiorsea bivora TaxID=1485545 RepID=UPI00056EF83F|nr:ATP-binding protein [Ghiorsea bivora]
MSSSKNIHISLLTKVSQHIKQRLSNRSDTEHVQAIIRIILTSIFFVVYFKEPNVLALIIVYLAVSVSILAWIIFSPKPSHTRKTLGIIGDMSMTSFVLYFANEAGILALPVYLWVIIGNGFRFGPTYLRISALCAIIGASIALSMDSYWSHHYWVSFVLLITLTAVPLYMSSLIKQLHEAISKAEQANNAKSQFLANMSHELRTPLNGIIGASELLYLSELDDKQKKYANMIKSSGHTLLSLIEDVLDISKIEAGKQTSEIKPFDLHELIYETLQPFLPKAEEKGVSLTSHIEPDVPFRLLGDELHLKQVLTNFLSNAIKFTEHGSIKVLVQTASNTPTSPTRIRFRVIDTGIGIPQEAQQNIFDSFVQADSSVTRKYGGTGLGTTISKELVNLMHGDIGLHSQEGKGSEFWCEIPFQHQKSINKEEIAISTSFSDARILTLISPQLLPQFVSPMQRWGQNVHSSHNVIDMVTTLNKAHEQAKPFHIAIVEQHLLGMSPEQLIKTVRDKAILSEVSFILVGEHFSPIESTLLVEMGFTAVLTYPLIESLLFNAIHEVCIGKQINHNIPSITDYHKRKTQRKLHILVAEDNEVNQDVIQEFLELMGHQVYMVDDGDKALDALTDDTLQFHLALLDINMPHMSGLDVIKAYRFIETDKHLPMIILSADAISSHIQGSLDMGADDYLTKPIEYHKLAISIDKLTQAKNTHAMIPAQKPLTANHEWKYIDPSLLDKLASMTKREHFIDSLVEKFIAGTTEKISSLEHALINHDTQTYLDTFHALKGSSGIVGATRIHEICVSIEQYKQPPNNIMQQHLEQLKKYFAKSSHELSHYIQNSHAKAHTDIP